jgi:methionyl aminopeptidase
LVIEMKTAAEVAKMRAAGLVVGNTLQALRDLVAPGVTTKDLDVEAERLIRAAGAVPSFLGYGSPAYPATLCTSVNEEIVHGIPRETKVLKAGDVVSIDCGAILDGWHGDSAITVGVGEVRPEVQRMLDICEEAMWRGIGAGVAGGKLSDIGHAVEAYVRSQGKYGIVEEYGGHGIGTAMHQDPHVPNYGKPGRGPTLAPGLALAVEPMINMGGRRTRILADKWTVVTTDGSWSAHFEHTFAVTPDGPFVTTALDAGASRLAGLVPALG